MIEDRYGFRHASASDAAIAAFERATFAIAAHRPGAAPSLADARGHDPDLAAAHALEGFGCLILARAELLAPARTALAAARAALAGGGTQDEIALVEALALGLAGQCRAAAARLEAALEAQPGMLLVLKLAQSLRFMAGDLPGLLAAADVALPGFEAGRAGYGFALGCRAFALEEAGHLAQAEETGRRAVAVEPADAWGFHAVAHVMETQGRVTEGIGWIEGTRATWSACNNFAFHMAWHLALFHLERGAFDAVLALYDAEIAPRPSDDFRDMANAVSLLWRLRQEGVAVGARWEALVEVAHRRRHDATLTFAALHGLLALAAAGDRPGMRDALAAMEARAAEDCEQAEILRAVGLDLARALAGGPPLPAARLAQIMARLPLIGGSHAQRDVFVRTLALSAADERGRDRVLAARGRVKRPDRFATRLAAHRADPHLAPSSAPAAATARPARAAGRP